MKQPTPSQPARPRGLGGWCYAALGLWLVVPLVLWIIWALYGAPHFIFS